MAKVCITIIGKGLNYRFERNLDVSKKQTVELASNKYNVDPHAFFIKRSNEYSIIFKEGLENPILVDSTKDVTAKVLKTARESQAVSKAIRELFSQHLGLHLGGRKIIFIGICVAVGAVAYLVFTGQLNLGGLFG
jgi:hypothetical protein